MMRSPLLRTWAGGLLIYSTQESFSPLLNSVTPKCPVPWRLHWGPVKCFRDAPITDDLLLLFTSIWFTLAMAEGLGGH